MSRSSKRNGDECNLLTHLDDLAESDPRDTRLDASMKLRDQTQSYNSQLAKRRSLYVT